MNPAKSSYRDAPSFVTKDNSLIRELFHPVNLGLAGTISLAEATVAAAAITELHLHHRSEELYYILAGSGVMSLGSETFPVSAGDTVRILPGTPHCIENTGTTPLAILCCCSPPYSHEDTLLLDTP